MISSTSVLSLSLDALRDGFAGAPRAADFGKDLLGRFCPDEGLGVGIVMVEIVVDGQL